MIKFLRFDAVGEPKAVVQILHGYGEHKEMYQGLTEYLNRHGFACVAYDQRGHGDLPRKKRGIVRNYKDFLDDMHIVREQISAWYPQLPVVLYGHSMGGNIALNYLLRHSQADYEKAVIESPWLRLTRHRPFILMALTRWLGRIFPEMAVNGKIPLDEISRDPDVTEALRNDPLFHNRMGVRIFAQIADAGEYILEHGSALTLPVLLLGGEDDRIVCVKAIRELADKAAQSVNYYEASGCRHVLHDELEPEKSDVLKCIVDFCDMG